MFSATFFSVATAAETPQPATTPESQDATVEVEGLKKKYWASGEESEMGVVQNRLFSKAKRFHLGISGGTVINDPFLSTKSFGVNGGYHFNEFWGVNLMYWKLPTQKSSALEAFESPPRTGAQANTNFPQAYYGGEVSFSPVYGKLSLMGSKIMYYDLHFLTGVGVTQTENGNYATGHVGIGQRFHISQSTSIRLDYRAMAYRETIKEKVIPSKLGDDVGQRINWNHSIAFGFEFTFGSVK